MNVSHLHRTVATTAELCLLCILIMMILLEDPLQTAPVTVRLGPHDEISLLTVLCRVKQLDHLTNNPIICSNPQIISLLQ